MDRERNGINFIQTGKAPRRSSNSVDYRQTAQGSRRRGCDVNIDGVNSRIYQYLDLNKDYIDVYISASQLTCRSVEGFDVGCKEGTPEGSSHGCFVGEQDG